MKKMLLATALALPYYTGCTQQTFTVQNKPAAMFKGNHHPSFLRFWNWAEKHRAIKFVAAQENIVKQETQQTFVNGLLSFVTLKHLYSALEARVYCSQ